MNHLITQSKRLLNSDGSLAESGWCTEPVLEYSPFDVRASKLRIVEYDSYGLLDSSGYAFSSIVADSRYMGLVSCTFYDINAGKKYDFAVKRMLPMGNMDMPCDSSSGDIYHRSKGCELCYVLENGGRHIAGKFADSRRHREMEFDLFFKQADDETMVIASGWATDKKAFRYNRKINCMPAEGYVKLGGNTYTFSPDCSLGTLDWVRCVRAYDGAVFTAVGNGYVDGKRFGFNIGYGCGNPKSASENAIFYDGKCHKLNLIRFEIPKSDMMQPWRFISSDRRFNMDFVPEVDYRTRQNASSIGANSHRIFGRISGTAVLDDGTRLKIKDLLVYAEKVHNRY